MPCSDGLAYDRMMEDQERKAMQKAVNTMAPLLCSACAALERLGYNFQENPALDEWYAGHRRADEQRELQEAQLLFERNTIKEALKKPFGDLTEEEKKIMRKHQFL